MTPVPLDLPLRPPDVAELAALVFQFAEGKPLTDEMRNRIGARAAALKLESFQPRFGSLARDPIHHSTYYLAVDVPAGPPLLLHMALASAPTSAIFAKALLIGRMRAAAGREVVVNAISFRAGDTADIDAFATRIDTAFLPRPQAQGITLVSTDPRTAFAAFRAVHKRTGKNVAAVSGPYHEIVWSAIRAGWRHGYTASPGILATAPASLDSARELIRRFPRYSRFIVAGNADSVQRLTIHIRESRSAAKVAGPFETGIIADSLESLASSLQELKTAGHPPQIAGIQPAVGEIPAYAAVARQFNCILSVSAARHSPDELRILARETGGRLTVVIDDIEGLAQLLLS